MITLTMQKTNGYGDFDISMISFIDDIEFETQYMMSGEDTAILIFNATATKEQIAALAEKTDIIDSLYGGDRQSFSDSLFGDKANFGVRAELRANVYNTDDNRNCSIARLLLECDDESHYSVCCAWEANLTNEEQNRLITMMSNYSKEMPLEDLIHHSKQASLEDIAVRMSHNGVQNITEFAVLDAFKLLYEEAPLVYEINLDTTNEEARGVIEQLHNRCNWYCNTEDYDKYLDELIDGSSIRVSVTENNTELILVERTDNGKQCLNVPITQGEKDMLQELVSALETMSMEYTSAERQADGSYNITLTDTEISPLVNRTPEFRKYGAHPFANLLLETDAHFYINAYQDDNSAVAMLHMVSQDLGDQEFHLLLSHIERRALANTIKALETERASTKANEMSAKKNHKNDEYER